MRLIQQLILVVKNFTARLESYDSLSGIDESLKKQVEVIRKGNEAEIERYSKTIPPLPSPELKIPRTIKTETIIKREQQDPWASIKLSVEIGTLLALIAYTGLVAYQLLEMKGATATAKKSADDAMKQVQANFVSDQRPYVWALGAMVEIRQDRIYMLIQLADFGKSPAIQERAIGKIFIGKNAIDKAGGWFKQFQTRHLSANDASPTILPPGIPPQIPRTRPEDPLILGYSTIRIGSSQEDPKDVRQASDTNGWIVGVARIDYFDTSGNFYSSELCWVRNLSGQHDNAGRALGEVTPCKEYNVIR